MRTAWVLDDESPAALGENHYMLTTTSSGSRASCGSGWETGSRQSARLAGFTSRRDQCLCQRQRGRTKPPRLVGKVRAGRLDHSPELATWRSVGNRLREWRRCFRCGVSAFNRDSHTSFTSGRARHALGSTHEAGATSESAFGMKAAHPTPREGHLRSGRTRRG